jgi:hypothetical protein
MPDKRSIEPFVVEVPHRQHRRLRSVHLMHRLTSDWSGDPSGIVLMTAGTRKSRRGGSGVVSDSTKRFDDVACQNASFRRGPAHGGG